MAKLKYLIFFFYILALTMLNEASVYYNLKTGSQLIEIITISHSARKVMF